MSTKRENAVENRTHVYERLFDGTVLVDVRGSLCPIPVIEAKAAMDAYPQAQLTTIVDNEVSRDNVVKFGQSRQRDVAVKEDGSDFYITFKGVQVEDDGASPFGSAAAATHMPGLMPKESIAIGSGRLIKKGVDMSLSGADTGLIDDPTTSAVSGPVESTKGRLFVSSNVSTSCGIVSHVQAEGATGVNSYSGKTLLVTKNYLGEGSEELGQTLMKTFWYCVSEADVKPKAIFFINSGVKMVAQESPHLENLQALAEAGVEIAACGICLEYYGLKDKVAVGSITNLYAITDAMMMEPMVTL